MKKIIIITGGIIGFIILIVLALGVYKFNFTDDDIYLACTEEAKLCPDGSAVGRIGSNCEFADCPINLFDTNSSSIIETYCEGSECLNIESDQNFLLDPNVITAMGYINNIYERDEKNYLDIDYIQWLNSEECKSKNIEAPSGFCILNEETKIRAFEISQAVEIQMQTLSHTVDGNYNWNEEISFERFKNIFTSSQNLKNVPYNIELKNNSITKIVEQYVP